MKLEVHFGEDFLHAAQGVGGFLLEAMTVAGEVAQGEDFLGGAKGFFEESCGVELLEPLGITDVGFFAGDSFDVTGVNEAAFDACGFEGVVAVDPVVAGAFHGNGGDVVTEEPVAQLMEPCGERGKGADVIFFAIAGDGDDDDFGSNVDACAVGLGFCIDLMDAGFVFPAFVLALRWFVDCHFVV